ncbi:MAG: PQQ-binding-like beta-propeller repeat protein [Candidatus Eisenbacteria bacterium]
MSITRRRLRAWLWVAVAAVILAAPPGPMRADAVAADLTRSISADARTPDLVLPSEPGPGFTREVLWERSVSFPGQVLLSGTVADLDGDGRHEVLLHGGRRNEPSGVVVLDGASGDVFWRAAFPQRSCVVAADLNGDGTVEVVVACGDELSVLDGATGEHVLGATLAGTIGDLVCARVCKRPAGGSSDGFGPGIVYTAGKKRDDVLAALAGDDLRELWSRDAVSASGPFASGFTHPSALDVDGDGRDEVLVAENGNHLLCLSGEGELAWEVGLGRRERLNPEGVVSSTPVLADFLGDGIAELAVGCFAGAVVVMNARTGEVLDRLQFGVESHESHLTNPKIPRFIRDALRETGEPVNCLTPVELDGGPGSELVLGCSDGFLYACDPGSGDVMWRFETRENVYDPCLLVGDMGEAPAAAGGNLSVAAAGGSTFDLLIWDVEGVYLLDGETGSTRAGFDNVAGAAGLIACDLVGTPEPELVRVAPAGGRVSAWSFAVSPGSASGPADGGSAPGAP